MQVRQLLFRTNWNYEPPQTGRPIEAASAERRAAIMQRAVAKDIFNWQAAKDYTFLQRTQEDALDGNGAVKSSKSETTKSWCCTASRLSAWSPKTTSRCRRKNRRSRTKSSRRKRASARTRHPEERQKRLQKYEKEREDERAFVREILDAYDFTLTGTEVLNGRTTWVIDGTPRPGFEGKRRESKMLPKIKPRFWIDQQDYSWTKLRAELTDTVSFGWVVARLHKGSVFEMQQVRVNDEVWLPQRFDVKLDARVALLKGDERERSRDVQGLPQVPHRHEDLSGRVGSGSVMAMTESESTRNSEMLTILQHSRRNMLLK